MNDYAPTKEDLEGGGGSGKAKPRGEYVGEISRAEAKQDKNGKWYLGFGIKLTRGKFSGGLIFENYLPLPNDLNKYQKSRRNSFLRAIDNGEQIPPGAPGGPDVSILNGTSIQVNLEHVYEDVPGQEYALETSSWSGSAWVKGGWKDCVDADGNLFKLPSGETITGEDGQPEPISPKETLTFYSVSDDFEGLGGAGDDGDDDQGGWGGGSESAASGAWG